MNEYHFKILDLDLVDRMQNRSTPDAPWAGIPPHGWKFLLDGIAQGVKWKVYFDVLEAYLLPKSKHATKAQERARERLDFEARELKDMMPSGIGLHSCQHLYDIRDGEDELPPPAHTRPEQHLARELLAVFWPDVPPLAWDQIKTTLDRRSECSTRDFSETRSVYANDFVDFGRAFRLLDHVGKLEPQPTTDWTSIMDQPPAPAVAAKKGRRP